MKYDKTLIGLIILLLTFSTPFAHAHEGHAEEETPALPMAVAPRVEAQSELFELLGVVEPDGLRFYLDHFATNEPVTNATIEVDWNGQVATATPLPDGTYRLATDWHQSAGEKALSFTITAGDEMDLLAGTLRISAAESASVSTSAHSHWVPHWVSWAAGAAGVLALAVVFGLSRRRGQYRESRA